MSEYYICKGELPKEGIKRVNLIPVPLTKIDSEACEYLWREDERNIWLVNGYDNSIDHYFAEAQKKLLDEQAFENTMFYQIIKKLLVYKLEIIL